MSWQSFLDESRRGPTYLVAVVTVRQRDLHSVRAALRDMVKPGQRRVHFAKESDSRRGEIVTRLHALDIGARIWSCRHPDDRSARRACLTAAAGHLLDSGTTRLVLESCQHQDALDCRTLAAVVGKAVDFTYEHLKPFEDPVLWVSDAVAWCHGAGGEWRRRVAGLVEAAVHVEVP